MGRVKVTAAKKEERVNFTLSCGYDVRAVFTS
jgi:hypothetical protein